VLVCHSLSCSLAAHWAARGDKGRVAAAFLVAPSDVEDPSHTPETVRGFAPIPRTRFPVPALVVASTDDPYVTLARAREFATSWGADFCNAGELGHINSASRLGTWPQGLVMLGQLLARVG
jgi:predicted alpha/beta hydrolase family esterase